MRIPAISRLFSRDVIAGRLSFPLPFALVLGCALLSQEVGAQTLRTDLWITNGSVNAIAVSGNTLYIGGNFTQVGPATGSGVAFDATTGAPLLPYPRIVGSLYCAVPDGSGGWFLGGFFTSVGGLPRNNLAKLDANGNVTPWNPGANASVFTMAVDGPLVYVGGDFTTIGGQPRSRIAALQVADGMVTSWNPNASSTVDGLLVDTYVYAFGSFGQMNNVIHHKMAKIDKGTGVATAWDPQPNSTVTAIALSGNTLCVAGIFTQIGGHGSTGLSGVDINTGAATSWQPTGPNGVITAMFPKDNTIVCCGSFTTLGDNFRNRLAAIDLTTGIATSWNPNADGTVNGMTLVGSTLYVGGNFTAVGGQPRSHLAAIDVNTGAPLAWTTPRTPTVMAMTASGGTVFASFTTGAFYSVGFVDRNNIAALDLTTGAATAWNPNAGNGVIIGLTVSGSTVYASGDFTNIGGQPRNDLAALDAGTGLATSWNPNPQPTGGATVGPVVVDGSTVYVGGGGFTSIGGQARNNIAAISASTGLATSWNPGSDGTIRSMILDGSLLYVAGYFTQIGGGQLRGRIAALSTSTGLATAWDPYANSSIEEIAKFGNTIYAVGSFTAIGLTARKYLAAIDVTSGNPTGWNPSTDADNSGMRAVVTDGSTVFVGGRFANMGGQARRSVAALDPNTGLAYAWNAGPIEDMVFELANSSGTLYMGGSFAKIQLLPFKSLAAISSQVVGVGADPTAKPVGELRASPNPFHEDVDLSFRLAEATDTDVAVYDIAGRVVRHLMHGPLRAGEQQIAWDGRGDAGVPVRAGLYIVRAQAGTIRLSAKVFRLN